MSFMHFAAHLKPPDDIDLKLSNSHQLETFKSGKDDTVC